MALAMTIPCIVLALRLGDQLNIVALGFFASLVISQLSHLARFFFLQSGESLPMIDIRKLFYASLISVVIILIVGAEFNAMTTALLCTLSSLLAFLCIQPLFGNINSGTLSLAPAAIVLSLSLIKIVGIEMPIAKPTSSFDTGQLIQAFALAMASTWLCYIGLLRWRVIAGFLVTAVPVLTLLFMLSPSHQSGDAYSAWLVAQLYALALMPILLAIIDTAPADKSQAWFSGFFAGLLHAPLSFDYNPIFALLIATLIIGFTTPLNEHVKRKYKRISRPDYWSIRSDIIATTLIHGALVAISFGTFFSTPPFLTGSRSISHLLLMSCALLTASILNMIYAISIQPHLLRRRRKLNERQHQILEEDDQLIIRARVTGALHPTDKE